MANHRLLVTFACGPSERALIADVLGGAATATFLVDLEPGQRSAALGAAAAVLARHTGKELQPEEASLLAGKRLLQFMTAGVDFVPLKALPPDLPIACNGGA